jgi:ADP-heptose:LPS heptosyltransferase
LQKNIRESDLDYFNQLNINNLGNLKFSNLAEEINKLDLVIACDTSILHLSSSLDVRTYALFPFVSDWRWIDSQINTKWYDSLEIFRLKKDQLWEELLNKVVNKIINLLE